MNTDHVRKEILTYCAAMPAAIAARGPAELANVALTLGNCFCWISPVLDEPGPQIEENLGQVPQSVFALGRQLQEVGRAWFERMPPPAQGPDVARLAAEVSRLDKLVHRLASERRAGK